MNVTLVARATNIDRVIIGAYALNLDLPFLPHIGMRFTQGSGTALWETRSGIEFPAVKEVVYNVDEETCYCLLIVKDRLTSSLWTEIEDMETSFALGQFVACD